MVRLAGSDAGHDVLVRPRSAHDECCDDPRGVLLRGRGDLRYRRRTVKGQGQGV